MPPGKAGHTDTIDPSVTSDKDPKWNTNDGVFAPFYLELIEWLHEQPVKFKTYVETMTASCKSTILCLDNNHIKLMEGKMLVGTLKGTFESPMTVARMPTAPAPPPGPPPTPPPTPTAGGDPAATVTATPPTITTTTTRSRFVEGPERIEEVGTEFLTLLLGRITDATTVKSLRRRLGPSVDGPNILLQEWKHKFDNLPSDSHQQTLIDLNDLLSEGFEDDSLESVIKLTAAVEELNESLPNTHTLRLRMPNVTLAAHYTSQLPNALRETSKAESSRTRSRSVVPKPILRKLS